MSIERVRIECTNANASMSGIIDVIDADETHHYCDHDAAESEGENAVVIDLSKLPLGATHIRVLVERRA